MGDGMEVIDGRKRPLALIVDDDETVRLLVRQTLEQSDFDVEEAENGVIALSAFRNRRPHIVLLDVVMPELDGYRTCRAIRQLPEGEHTTILMMTGLDDVDSINEAFDAGATDFITKPMNYLILGHRVRYMLRTMQAFESLRESRRQIRHLAYYDSLTNLPNRRLFGDRLNHSLEIARRENHLVALLFIDLDNFKRINDTFGHTVGDNLLQAVARRLLHALRKSDTVSRNTEGYHLSLSRLGGDEFTVLLEHLKRVEDVAKVARRITETLSAPFLFGKEEVVITPSIGIAVYPHDGKDNEELIKNADTAMYCAKDEGRNNYQFYTASMNASSFERLSLENNLRKALDREELQVYYQPKIDLARHKVSGMEALMRWNHPDLGMISPDEFIPLAEQTGLIVGMGEWVIRTVCRQMQEWVSAGQTGLKVAVNLSARQFRQDNLVDVISDVIRETSLDPQRLELELTESVIIDDLEASRGTLAELKAMGIRISLDDFGTGYSSLRLLKELPIDSLKIDQSFIRDITSDVDDAAIVSTLISLAHNLKLRVIAEGVETGKQLEYLRVKKCDEAQGYLIARPMTADAFENWIQEHRKSRRSASSKREARKRETRKLSRCV